MSECYIVSRTFTKSVQLVIWYPELSHRVFRVFMECTQHFAGCAGVAAVGGVCPDSRSGECRVL